MTRAGRRIQSLFEETIKKGQARTWLNLLKSSMNDGMVLENAVEYSTLRQLFKLYAESWVDTASLEQTRR
jgi:hypothetical protein